MYFKKDRSHGDERFAKVAYALDKSGKHGREK